MQTRCPYPSCLLVFSPPPSSRTCRCPGCGNTISVRPLEVSLDIDRKTERIGTPLRDIDTSSFDLMVLLDDVRSLWNVGSIFRSADGAGFDALFLAGITGTPPRKEIAKTSLGAEDHVPWFFAGNTVELIQKLKREGVFILSLEFTTDPPSVPLRQALQEDQVTLPLCLCVGNEVTGVSAEILANSDLICHLPMRGFKESLNVAVAFGIAAYEIAESADNE